MTDENKSKGKQVTVSPLDIPDLSSGNIQTSEAKGIGFLKDVPVTISVELGRVQMDIEQVLRLGTGSLITLPRQVSEPVDLYINEKLIGHGEIVAVDDYFGVRITEIIDREQENNTDQSHTEN